MPAGGRKGREGRNLHELKSNRKQNSGNSRRYSLRNSRRSADNPTHYSESTLQVPKREYHPSCPASLHQLETDQPSENHHSSVSLQDCYPSIKETRDDNHETECDQECSLKMCCHEGKAMLSQYDGKWRYNKTENESMLLKTFKPQRSYSLRLKRTMSPKTFTSANYNTTKNCNGPVNTKSESCTSCSLNPDNLSNSDVRRSSCVTTLTQEEEQSQYSDLDNNETSLNSTRKMRRKYASEDSESQSGISEAKSEIEDVVMTTAC